MRVVFRFSESNSGPISKPQWPMVFDLINDPIEQWDLIDTRLDCAWVFRPVAMKLGALATERGQVPARQAG